MGSRGNSLIPQILNVGWYWIYRSTGRSGRVEKISISSTFANHRASLARATGLRTLHVRLRHLSRSEVGHESQLLSVCPKLTWKGFPQLSETHSGETMLERNPFKPIIWRCNYVTYCNNIDSKQQQGAIFVKLTKMTPSDRFCRGMIFVKTVFRATVNINTWIDNTHILAYFLILWLLFFSDSKNISIFTLAAYSNFSAFIGVLRLAT